MDSAPSLPLVDTFGRVHDMLRLSVTDRCNLRCVYCMPEHVEFLDPSQVLSFEEMVAFVRSVWPLGIRKVRLTGGEPLLRRQLHLLVEQLLQIPGLTDLGLTTNGLLLANQAEALHRVGLRSINVSLDTLDAQRFRELTRRDALSAVREGIAQAKRVGLRIKLNAVAIRGMTEADIIPLAHFARDNDIFLRFIEYMPIGAEPWERAKLLPAHEILEVLEGEFGPITPSPHYDPHAPAMQFHYADGKELGIIASVSRPFCRSCNRLRLTAEGKFRNCLFALDEVDVKPFLRPTLQEEPLHEAIRQSVRDKWEGHEINTARFLKPLRTMHAIGG